MIKQRKEAGMCWDEKRKATQFKQTIQLEEINQKVLAKERRLKIYRDRIKQYRQKITLKKQEKNHFSLQRDNS